MSKINPDTQLRSQSLFANRFDNVAATHQVIDLIKFIHWSLHYVHTSGFLIFDFLVWSIVSSQDYEKSGDKWDCTLYEWISVKIAQTISINKRIPDLGVIWRQYKCMKFFCFQKCDNQQFATTGPPQGVSTCYKSIFCLALGGSSGSFSFRDWTFLCFHFQRSALFKSAFDTSHINSRAFSHWGGSCMYIQVFNFD